MITPTTATPEASSTKPPASAPAAEEKEVPFEEAAMGVTGLETAFAAIHTDLVLPGALDLGLVVEKMGGGAEPFGLERPAVTPGSEANVALCDLGAEWTVGEEGYESRSRNSWCAGRTLTGRVLMTVARAASAGSNGTSMAAYSRSIST